MMFAFSINVEISASRHIAKQVQEAIWEAVEDFPVDERVERWQMNNKLHGFSVVATPLKQIKE